MFKKIKEFIKAFKNAYNTINVNKFNAKKAIDDYSKGFDDIVYITESLKIIFARLEAVYKCFPIKERQDFIQKTLDIISYGRRDTNGDFIDIYGWRILYYIEADDMRKNLAYLKNLYKKSKYDEVVTKAEEYSERLKEFYTLYGIEENPKENNE